MADLGHHMAILKCDAKRRLVEFVMGPFTAEFYPGQALELAAALYVCVESIEDVDYKWRALLKEKRASRKEQSS